MEKCFKDYNRNGNDKAVMSYDSWANYRNSSSQSKKCIKARHTSMLVSSVLLCYSYKCKHRKAQPRDGTYSWRKLTFNKMKTVEGCSRKRLFICMNNPTSKWPPKREYAVLRISIIRNFWAISVPWTKLENWNFRSTLLVHKRMKTIAKHGVKNFKVENN